MNRVVRIMMDRDNNTEKEAKERLAETQALIYDALAEGADYEVEEILMEELGLEMDYIFDVL